MQFPCSKLPLERIAIGPAGTIEPLCHSCANHDCSNPIELQEISIFGITQTWRLFNSNGKYHCVMACEGFLSLHKRE